MGGLLSFPPDMGSFELQPLNVLIGPNGSGKTNFIEVLELLRAAPVDLAAAIRDGGGAGEWLWKGTGWKSPPAPTVEVETGPRSMADPPLRYRLSFSAMGPKARIQEEAIEEAAAVGDCPRSWYRYQQGMVNIRVRTHGEETEERTLPVDEGSLDQSVLAQRRDPDLYPELTWLARQLAAVQSFRDWTFGRYGATGQRQRADPNGQRLLPDCSNLAHVLNEIEHVSGPVLNEHLKRFFPRFERMSTLISGGTVQLYLHESGFSSPIPATRLSDGTLRFIALLAILLSPSPPPLVCMEEPEFGLHPDAVAMLADLLVEASQRMQLVVTTHSDALVSGLTDQPAAIVACERPGAGTELRRLEPERLSGWLDEYRLGDLWRMGELGANP